MLDTFELLLIARFRELDDVQRAAAERLQDEKQDAALLRLLSSNHNKFTIIAPPICEEETTLPVRQRVF